MSIDTDLVHIINDMIYEPVGHCIYCGSTMSLQKEHILPLGLSGTAVLPKASCSHCARITGQQEQLVLRGPFWPVRVFRSLHSRTKHRDAPSHFPITIERNHKEEVIELPIEEYPILLHFPIFPPPAFLEPDGYTNGIRVTGVATISFGPSPEEVGKNYGATSISLNQSLQPVAFARVLAKIAYSMAVADNALARIKGDVPVLPAILGEKDDIGMWVGTLPDPIKKIEGHLHRVTFHSDISAGLLIAEVHLFSDSETPRYGVVIGQLR
ncbi:hypothetical protein [Geobacter sp.]|uniref:hypothetical protein n=1 Tax=Geobacter sp. TaxID=46610 RepID=UPI0027BA98C7|nr:hypothetical protein [Geobacter sp.]